ncbi:VWA domain-containing protein [Vibrio owensii]|uniref:VWA domain-containing protein n=1 Tax=Vibrio harveyi group TaxID=717610 RepID=UPI003CC53CCB
MLSLDKKLESIADQPELVSLVKKSALSLEKKGVDVNSHTAQVALCVDLSGSMAGMLAGGTVSEIIKRSVAQGITFDDDGEIDVFAFGTKARYDGTVNAAGLEAFSNSFRHTALMGGTNYHEAVNLIVNHYKESGFEHPVYVIFVTDGDTGNKPQAEKAIKKASKYPIFFQFVGIGREDYIPGEAQVKKPGLIGRMFGAKPKVVGSSTFEFLIKLDEMDGRHVDNAGFFAVKKPSDMSPERMFELLNGEYPEWLEEIRAKGMI